MHLTELMSREDLREAIASGDVVEKKHPYYRLSIYTYTKQCQYKNNWTNVTLNCRGLIVDETTGDIVARPFPKFFNYSQHGHGYPWAPEIPEEDFRIFEKVDGSLGIVFHYAGKWLAASKGSFMSEQAQWAQARLDNPGVAEISDPGDYGFGLPTDRLIPGYTYLCEIIYPANRIVVNYGDLETMILTGVYSPDGLERPISKGFAIDWAPIGPVVKEYDYLPFSKLVEMAESNRHPDGPTEGSEHEGWVLRFASGTRVKIKYGDYIRLHKVLTGVNARDVWKALAVNLLRNVQEPKHLAMTLHCSPEEIQSLLTTDHPLSNLIEAVPDEFYQWVTEICDRLMKEAERLNREIFTAWERLSAAKTPREYAAGAQAYPEPVRAALFKLRQGRAVTPIIWAFLRPDAEKPFKEDNDE